MTEKQLLTTDQTERLARFETVLAQVQENLLQTELAMAQIKEQGNTNSYRFKELIATKMTNNAILAMFKNQNLI